VTYRAEIEIAVKGANQLSSFQGKLNESALAVDNLNKFLEIFTNKGEGIVRSISNLTGQLGQAAEQFNEVALGTKEAETAAVNYLQATRNLNAGLQERAALLAEVIENERQLKLASAGIRETTQFSGPIGPGQASPVDALVGQSSNVEGLVKRNIDIRSDDLQLEQALLKLKERQADAVFEELKSSEALIRSANEAKLIAAEARGERPSSQLQILSPEQELRQQGIERAEQIARDASLKSKANQEEFEAEKRYAREIFNIEQDFNKKLRDEEIDNILEKIKLESDLQEELFNKALKNDNILLDINAKKLEARTAEFEKQLNIAKQIAKSNPVGGAENIPGSPAFLKARSKRRREAASNAVIGGAFPLLFGQGAGASLGGALGGGLGGLAGGQFGFGLSLVGTGVGQAFDTLIAKAAELGKALDPVNGDVDTVIQSLGLTNQPLGKLIKGFEELAGKEAALEIATAELANLVGNNGVEALKDFGEASVELGNNLQKVATQLAASVTKTLQGPLEFLAKQAESVSLRTQAFQSNDPRIIKLREQIGNRQSPTSDRDLEVLREIEQLQRKINEENEIESQKQLESKIKALSPANQLLDTAERNLEVARLQDDILNDQVFKLKQQQIEADLSVGIAELRRKAEGNILLQLRLQKDEKRLQVEADTKLVQLTQQRNKAQTDLNEKTKRDQENSRRERERADREAKRNAERIEQERVQKAQAFTQASLSLIETSVNASRVDKGDLKAIDRELKLIKIKKGLQEDAILLAKEDIKIQNLRFTTLDQETKIRVRLLNLERERIKLSIEQEKIDEQRNQRSQIESVRRESFGFTAQIADPFNLNPERLRAAESEERKNDILRAEREKLEDLERRGAALKPFASSESVTRLAEQIDIQKAFIPQLEAELNLRNQLEAAASRQSAIIEKYGFIADEVATAVSSSVQAIITGTGSVEEAFSNLFQNIGQAFVNLATQVLAQKAFFAVLNLFNPGSSLLSGGLKLKGGSGDIFSDIASRGGLGLKGFADGGRPPVNRPSIVGEQGPELFVPFQQGTIVSNEDLQEQMAKAGVSSMERPSSSRFRETRDSSSSRFRETREVMVPFTRSAEQLSVASAERETAQAISNPRPLDVRFESQVINNVEYVTADQYRKGMSQAAERGRALTLQALQNSVKARKRIGL